MACSAGLASDIEQALDMVPIQMIECLAGLRRVKERSEGNASWDERPIGTPQDFAAMALGANVDGLEVRRAG